MLGVLAKSLATCGAAVAAGGELDETLARIACSLRTPPPTTRQPRSTGPWCRGPCRLSYRQGASAPDQRTFAPVSTQISGPLSLQLMPTIELTDEQIRIIRAALDEYLENFGHGYEGPPIPRRIGEILDKLPEPLST
jgi:hypothetical protein